ncbi:cationic peroxidase SPC4-like [Oryza brachyantha]|uniref:Peroxidase n=1 Tax=Oryza brachyantha TaxID=4533 RepID=J3M2X9_ORYBR|nr:cationic peroxidase SPC4-like [Oryza brachyantha]
MGAVSRMSAACALAVVAVLLLISSPPAAAAAAPELSVDFHAASCPQLQHIVSYYVEDALQREIAIAAGLIRIFFHDCFPQGCDASVYLNDTAASELRMPPNLSLQPKALQLVEDIRAKVHAACGPTVSCADISALATRDAVVVSGGPSYDVLLGRKDSLAPAREELVLELPSPRSSTIKELLDGFKNRSRGLGEPADLVALSGGHTVGKASCGTFQDRADRQEDTFSKKLKANCSRDSRRLQNLDVITPDAFDNGYYIALTYNQGVFTSDMALIKDPQTRPIVRQYAQDKAAFFNQFAKSMVKLSNVPTLRLDDNNGEIRRNCFASNKAPRVVVQDTTDDEDEGFAASA